MTPDDVQKLVNLGRALRDCGEAVAVCLEQATQAMKMADAILTRCEGILQQEGKE